MPLVPLPIDDVLSQVVAALRQADAVVLRAPTGAGKTTRVPPALLDAGLAGQRSIVVLQPRRLAARACARRMAWERGSPLGEEVGYQVRFERCIGRGTRIQVVTEGILLRMLQDDPFLESVGLVVFDEFHQRSLNSDLALAMVERVRQTVRPDLKLAVMSATLDPGPVARYLHDCPTVESKGRLYPVEIAYDEGVELAAPVDRVERALLLALDRTDGDILVFLPGVGEIRRAARRLQGLAHQRGLLVAPLYGDLSAEAQDQAIAPGTRRKIVLATNVAETSITIEGITGVIDTGLARLQQFDPHLGLDRLQMVRISQAAADQRAGRAGRLRPGLCLRLWHERTNHLRPDREEPEIRRLDLAGPVLQLRAWGEGDIGRLPWFEPPAADAVAQAEALLARLDALDGEGKVTAAGRIMARLPVGPRLGRMLLEGQRLGRPGPVALAAALLSDRDPFRHEIHETQAGAGRPQTHLPPSRSDVLDRVLALEAFEERGELQTPLGRLHRFSAQFALHVRNQLLQELRLHCGDVPPEVAGDEALLRAVLAAFPDRLVRRSSPGSRFGRMVGGRGAQLAVSSAVRESPLFVAVDVDRRPSEALVWKASAVERDWLPDERLLVRVEVEFDPKGRQVVARRRVYWDDLLLEESPRTLPGDEQVAAVLASAAAQSLEEVFPWDDPAAAGFVQRVRFLRQWMPELDWPAMDDDALRAALPTVCRGRRSFEELRGAPWPECLQALLTPEQQRALAREAPLAIQVPSGSRIRLVYESGKAPVLAVRIQEIFGMLETPRVAAGRVAVLLHLLAPNHRPQQVTDDLASFWRTTYHQVRKDLRRRYPKHAWPEDPYQATAERRPRRRDR